MIDFPQKAPINYLRTFLKFVRGENYSVEPWAIEHFEAVLTQASSIDGFISLQESIDAHYKLITAIDDPALGLKYGQYLSLADHGPLGALTSVCSSVYEILQVFSEFSEIRIASKFKIQETALTHKIILSNTPDYESVLVFHTQTIIAGFLHTIVERAGFIPDEIEVGLPFEKEFDYRPYFPFKTFFNQKECFITLPKEFTKMPLLHNDSVTKQLFSKLCEDVLENVRADITISNSILQLFEVYENYPNLDQIAAIFHLTPRTLRNRLAKENKSFRDLVLSHKMKAAKKILRNTNLTIDHISERIFYSNPGNFCRAFKREESMSPSEYREQFTSL